MQIEVSFLLQFLVQVVVMVAFILDGIYVPSVERLRLYKRFSLTVYFYIVFNGIGGIM